jgi:hypothetical protein
MPKNVLAWPLVAADRQAPYSAKQAQSVKPPIAAHVHRSK